MALPSVTQADAARLWSRVLKTDGCWIWRGAVNERGYGKVAIRGMRYTHRVAWEVTHGPIPEGLCVLHRCDHPPCCRPDHLFLGTRAENIADCVAKGRQRPRGKGHQTQCPQGHVYAEVGTYDHWHRGVLSRKCRACGRARAAERRACLTPPGARKQRLTPSLKSS